MSPLPGGDIQVRKSWQIWVSLHRRVRLSLFQDGRVAQANPEHLFGFNRHMLRGRLFVLHWAVHGLSPVNRSVKNKKQKPALAELSHFSVVFKEMFTLEIKV